MNKLKFQFRRQYAGGQYAKKEFNYEPSKTVPDQSMSLREIKLRFMSGRPIPMSAKSAFFSGEEGFPGEWDLMDQIEREQWIRDNAEHIRDLNRKIQEHNRQLRDVVVPVPGEPPVADERSVATAAK